MEFHSIEEPGLFVSKERAVRNLIMMADKCQRLGLGFRPHFKTHQSKNVGNWFREMGVRSIAVSSLAMAEYFQEAGWEDIMLAFPVNPQAHERIKRLAKSCILHLVTSSSEAVESISQSEKTPLRWWIKVDCGNHRAGLDPQQIELILKLAAQMDHQGSFEGVVAHAGQFYRPEASKVIAREFERVNRTLGTLKKELRSIYPKARISFGDTPSSTLREDFGMIDELRPGNFIFFDWMQREFGVCKEEEIALCMACPIVEVQKKRNEVLVHGGAIHFSKDHSPSGIFGQVVEPPSEGLWGLSWEGCVLDRVSQEHGILRIPEEKLPLFKVGQTAWIIPAHSCLSIDVMRGYTIMETGEKIFTYRKTA